MRRKALRKKINFLLDLHKRLQEDFKVSARNLFTYTTIATTTTTSLLISLINSSIYLSVNQQENVIRVDAFQNNLPILFAQLMEISLDNFYF